MILLNVQYHIYILTRTNLTSRFDSGSMAKGIQPEKAGTDLANEAWEKWAISCTKMPS